MRCVLDTNIFISALLLPDSKPGKALRLARQTGPLLLSFDLLAELYQVLTKPRFQRYVDDEDVHAFLASLAREGEWVEVDVQLTVCRDAKDNKVLELAVSGRATHIVTGDSDLLTLHPFSGIQIMTPNSFLELAS